MKIIHKQRTSDAHGMEFVLSDETKDRMGDVIRADGWKLDDFKKNPIALFGHSSSFPIGTWKEIRVENKSLISKLELAPEGTSPRIDEIRWLVEHRILRAVSVGFREIESRPFGKDFNDGIEFLKQELVETSLVSVPANPNALAIAKSLKISDDVRHLVFAEHGNRKRNVRHAKACDIPDMLSLRALEQWTPYEANGWKNWAAQQARLYPNNPKYRKLHKLMDEIETVRTIAMFAR